jgi:hypothetical protein
MGRKGKVRGKTHLDHWHQRFREVAQQDSVRRELPRNESDLLPQRSSSGLTEDEPLEDDGDGECEAERDELFGATKGGRVEAGTSPGGKVAAVSVL